MEKIIFVASGKGGVGKSTISSNVAAALCNLGRRVLVIDGDVAMGNLDLLFGVRSVFDMQDVFYGHCSPEKVVNKVEGFPGLSFIAAPAQLRVPKEKLYFFVANMIKDYSNAYDNIIVDCPAGAAEDILPLLTRRCSAIVVATPDITSIRDAERVAAVLRKKRISDVRLVVNRVDSKMIDKKRAPDIDDIIDSTSVRLLGLVPEDRQVIACANRGVLPFSSKRSRSRTAFANIALRLTGKDVRLGLG